MKAASFSERTSQRIASIPWKRYALFGILGPILIPVWIVIASTTISYQGLSSRRRTRDIITADGPLYRIRERASTANVDRYRDDDGDNDSSSGGESDDNNNYTQALDGSSEQIAAATPVATTKPSKNMKEQEQNQGHSVVAITAEGDSAEPETVVSYSYPHLKTIQPLALLPVQVEISRNLNTLEWKKNIIHIEGMNAHASIVVREKRFSNEGGVAAVQHAVDMFRDDGEDE